MLFVTAVAFVMYQKVHLLLDDIVLVIVEGDERCLGGLRMMNTLPLFRTTQQSFPSWKFTNRCVVLIN